MNQTVGRSGLVIAALLVALCTAAVPCEAQAKQAQPKTGSAKPAKSRERKGRAGSPTRAAKPRTRPVEQGVTAIKPAPTPQAPGQGAPPPGPAGTSPALPDIAAMLRGTEGDPGLVTMDFRGTDIANVLKFFALATNWQIVPDAALTGPVTIISPKQLTIDQAFTVLQSTLEVRGFVGQLEKRSNTAILKIVPLDRAVQTTGILRGPDGAATATPDDLRNQVITQVIPIENVDAANLARELQPLINKGANIVGSAGTNALVVTDTAGNVRRISELVQMLDKAASNNKITRFPLKRADATEVAASLNNLFRQVFNRGRGGQGQPNQPGMPPGMVMGPNGQPMPAGTGQERGAIVTVADVRTNSVIVAASEENTKRVEQFITELDGTESAALKTRIVKMKAADAAEVADTINTVLSGASGASATRGGASFAQRVFGGFGGFGGGGGQPGSVQSSDPFAKVVADQRTNSIIITATDERMKKIDELIEVLDVQVPQETTTFVMPLKNAQAPEMAAILGQAFGTSSGNFGGFNQGFGGFNIFGQQARTNQRRTSTQRRQTGRSAPIDGAGASRAGVRGTLTATGFVPDPDAADEQEGTDAPDSRQFIFGGPFGGFGGRGNFQTPQFGRGRTGSFVNLLQLRNNVGVVADPASNSLILTTTPDNLEELKKIIETLDVVPSQVMIEVIIAEANVEDTQKLGFQFDVKGVGKLFGSLINQTGSSNFPINNAGTTSTNIDSAIVPGAQYGIQSSNYSALVQALQTDSRIRILSTPKVFTSNNQQGTIDITTRVPYVTSAYSGGLNLGQSVNYDYLDLGITLDVTPRITADGMVTIDVVATSSELLGFDTMQSSVDSDGRSTSIQAPRYSNRETNTSVTTRDGEIVAIGGLMRESGGMSTHKVPLLGDIPLLGHLFRSTTKTTSKTELMLFLVPRVVTGESSARAVTQRAAAAVGKDVPQLLKNEPGLRQGAGPQSEKPGSKPTDAPPAKP